MYKFQKMGFVLDFEMLAGVDEVGRGALAGPVISASVIFSKKFIYMDKIKDSKQLSFKERECLYNLICKSAVSVGVGIVGSSKIDEINILNASLLSMSMAVKNLIPRPDCILVDGIYRVPLNITQFFVKKGDVFSGSIGAASIVAKVLRDKLMSMANLLFPVFEFNKNKGYSTKIHRENIKKFGPCFLHRKTFKGVKEYID